jgi:hypothetical protein
VDKLERQKLKTDRLVLEAEHTVDYLAHHTKQMKLYGGIAVAVLLVVGVIYGLWSNSRTERQNALRAAMAVQDGYVGEVNPTGGPTFKTQTDKETAAIKAFNDVATKYSGSDEGLIAKYYGGTILADQGKVAEAQKAFQEVADKGGTYGSLAKFSLAKMYFAQGKYKESQQLMKELADKPTLLVSKEQAQIEYARALFKTDSAEARKILEEIMKTAKDRPAVTRFATQVLGEGMNR